MLFRSNPATRISSEKLIDKIQEFLNEFQPSTNCEELTNGNSIHVEAGNSLSKFLHTSLQLAEGRRMQASVDQIHLETSTNHASCFVSGTNHLSKRSLKEVYHLWQLAGGDVIAELKRQGLTRKKAAILTLPRYK